MTKGTPVKVGRKKYDSVMAAARDAGIHWTVAHYRLNAGWTPEETFRKHGRAISDNVTGYVYLITNSVNDKKYVGVTTRTLKQRLAAHITSSKAKGDKSYGLKICKAIRKLGADKFSIRLLKVCDTRDELGRAETRYIKKYDCIANGYNSMSGGKVARNTGLRVKYKGKWFNSQSELARHLGVSPTAIHKRVQDGAKLDVDRRGRTSAKPVKWKGKFYESQTALAKALNTSPTTVCMMLKNHKERKL